MSTYEHVIILGPPAFLKPHNAQLNSFSYAASAKAIDGKSTQYYARYLFPFLGDLSFGKYYTLQILNARKECHDPTCNITYAIEFH